MTDIHRVRIKFQRKTPEILCDIISLSCELNRKNISPRRTLIISKEDQEEMKSISKDGTLHKHIFGFDIECE